MADTGGYDLAAAWASSGTAFKLTPTDGQPPPLMPPGFFDLHGANAIAGAIGTALFQRERTGHAPVVDVSLLGVGMWSMGPDIVGAQFAGSLPSASRTSPGNPIVNCYPTKDERWIYLVCLQGDRFWPEVCEVIGRPDLITDERFIDTPSRFEHREVAVEVLDAVFRTRTLAEWCDAFANFSGVWAPAISFTELHEHQQVEPNGFLPTVEADGRKAFRLVGPPAQFDERPAVPRGPAPELGQDTEAVLLELGLDWDEITELRERGATGA
jgi:formyl-CoA transferase